MLSTISAGIVLGLSAGFSPGPLLALVISETLQHDIRAGIKVAVAPIITDLPIIIFSLFIINEISGLYNILGLISLLVGSKIVLAVAVGKYKSFLNGAIYIYTIRALGLILWILSVVLIYDGLKLLGFV